MSFNTTSYLAGVGTVVAALTIGFSGGFFLANPTQNTEQNRLQRVTSSAPISSPAPQAATTPKPEITEANATPAPIQAAQQPAVQVTQTPSRVEPIAVVAKSVEPAPAPIMTPAPVMAKAPEASLPEPVGAAPEQERAASANAEKLRAAEAKAEAKAAERKRAEARKLAERRKQKEIETATVAVKRMLRDREPQQVADGFESPRFGFFGQD